MSTKLSRRFKQLQSSAQHKVEKLFRPAHSTPRPADEKKEKENVWTDTKSADSKSITNSDVDQQDSQGAESTQTRSSADEEPNSAHVSIQIPQPPRSETSATSTTTHPTTPTRTGRVLRNRPRVDYKQLHTTGRKLFK
jgi:hypothetical protein